MPKINCLSDFGTFKWEDFSSRTFNGQVDKMLSWYDRLDERMDLDNVGNYIFRSNVSSVSLYSCLVIPPDLPKTIDQYEGQVEHVSKAAKNIKREMDDQDNGHIICIMTADWKKVGTKYDPRSGHTQGLVIQKISQNHFSLYLYHSYFEPQLVYKNRTVIKRFLEIFNCNQIIHCVEKNLNFNNKMCFASSMRFLYQFIHQGEDKVPEIQVWKASNVSKVSKKTFTKVSRKSDGQSGKRKRERDKVVEKKLRGGKCTVEVMRGGDEEE